MKKLSIVILILLMAVPTMAADWNFYGNVRMSTWYESGKAAALFNPHDNGNLNERDNELTWEMAGNSRIGAKVQHGNVEGVFEYGTGVNLRHLYAKWTPNGPDSWYILVGQTYTPISSFFISNQVYFEDEDMDAEGIPYIGRKPQIQLGYKGLTVAFIQTTGTDNRGSLYPNADGSFDFNAGVGLPGDIDVWLPKFEALYHLMLGPNFMGDLYGGYQTWRISNPLGGGSDLNVNSYIIGGAGNVTFGPMYFRAQVSYGQNWGDYGTYDNGLQHWGMPMTSGAAPALAQDPSRSVLTLNLDAAGNPSYDIQNTYTFGVAGLVGYKFNDHFEFEFGTGYLQHDNDYFINKAKLNVYYLNTTITLAKGIFIVPEVGYYDLHDRLDSDRDAESFWYAGAKWQINF